MGQQQLILYLAATIVAIFVLLIVFNVEQRSTETALEAIRYRAAKQDMLNLVEAIEQDFKNIGSYLYKTGPNTFVGETMSPSDAVMKDDSVAVPGGQQHTFEFRAQTDSLQPPNIVRYVWKPAGETVTLQDGTVRPLYTVQRSVDGTPDGSSNTITEMNIELLPGTTNGVPITVNLWDTQIIRVSLAGVSSLGKGDLVEETRFDAVYRPVPMTITNQ